VSTLDLTTGQHSLLVVLARLKPGHRTKGPFSVAAPGSDFTCRRQTQAGRRKLAFEDASRRVTFAADWWNATKQFADSPEAEQQATTRALSWLEQASTRVAESNPPSVEENPAITLSRLFLTYPPRDSFVWPSISV
jgi:hypothetical protein